VEFYPRGNWIVGPPIWVLEDQDEQERISMMLCPHPQWKEIARAQETNPEDGKTYLVVSEECTVCGAKRLRLLPAGFPENEPFDYSIPEKGPWYERLYNLGNFVILVRRYNNNPEVPPSYMTRTETQAGNVHTGVVQLETLLFSPAALEQIVDMERMMKLGPKRYAGYRILKEGRKTKEDKADIQAHADALAKVVQDIGPESIAAARAIFEAEIDQEAADLEEYQIQMMEKEVAERKAQIEKRRAGKKPK